jgi:hypothetical protein
MPNKKLTEGVLFLEAIIAELAGGVEAALRQG